MSFARAYKQRDEHLGRAVFVFVAELFPEYAPLNVVNDHEGEVVIFYLRPTR